MSFEDEVNFCINFLKAQDVSEKSCVYSPISLLNSLAMVYAGCDGNTAKEIENVIGKGKIKDEIINYYSNYIKRHKAVKEDGDDKIVATLLSEGSGAKSSSYSLSDTTEANTKLIKDDEPVKFKVNATNKLFVDISTKVLDSFIEIINQKFDGEIHLVNFKEKNSEAVNQISKFVNDTTNQLIYRESQGVNVETKIILLNETYFIGRWATPFISREKGTFYSKIPREIDFMQKDKVCNYIEGDDWKCVGIPYKGWNIWMFVILPNENDGLQGLINKMDYSLLMECTIGEIQVVDVTIPAFEICGNYDLVNNLSELGIHDLSNPSDCNLSKMIDKTSCGCYVYKAIHRSAIKIDEYGTGVGSIRRDDKFPGVMTEEFKADHPFMYCIASVDKSDDEENDDFYAQKLPTEILFTGVFC